MKRHEQPSDVLLDELGMTNHETIFDSPLDCPEAVFDWQMEGPGVVTFPAGRMRLESTAPVDAGQAGNFVFWCPDVFPDFIRISWDFHPLQEPGLAILFFSATGQGGEHILAPTLAPRKGPYNHYHSGDINALHVSYFRRWAEETRRFHTCNLRKSCGFHLVCRGADPIPSVAQSVPPYRIAVIKAGTTVRFCIEDLSVFTWEDPGTDFGPVLGEGSVGFRQMNPLIAEYANLKVERLEPAR